MLGLKLYLDYGLIDTVITTSGAFVAELLPAQVSKQVLQADTSRPTGLKYTVKDTVSLRKYPYFHPEKSRWSLPPRILSCLVSSGVALLQGSHQPLDQRQAGRQLSML